MGGGVRRVSTIAFAALLLVLASSAQVRATHDAYEFALCNPSIHHNYYDINWHFSNADGIAFNSTAQSTIRYYAVPQWHYRDTSQFHTHYDSSGPWHILPTQELSADSLGALTLPGQVQPIGGCGGGQPYLPYSGDHLTATEIRINWNKYGTSPSALRGLRSSTSGLLPSMSSVTSWDSTTRARRLTPEA